MKKSLCIATPVGPLTIRATARAVTAVRFGAWPPDEGAETEQDSESPQSTKAEQTADHSGTQQNSRAEQNPTPFEESALGQDWALDQESDAEHNADADAASALLRQAARELREYFAGARRTFDFPLALEGTSFQCAVWEALRGIPFGETRTYAEIARGIGRPKACRAVGMANHRNPAVIVVPCHRVIGSSGALTGFAGGLETKERLLRLEREVSKTEPKRP